MAAPFFVRILLVGSALLLVVSWWQRDALPAHDVLDPALLAEPQQVATDTAPFRATVGGIEYTVRPLYTYDLYGLVVSKHDADAWWDWIHKAWNDKLNVTDLCVISGPNARDGNYRAFELLERRIRVQRRRRAPPRCGSAFDMKALSNNHLLTDDPAIARTLKSMRVGDQVHFRGYLAEYSHEQGFHFFRGTSITRDDQGDGACETVYATDAEILHQGNRGWRIAFWARSAGCCSASSRGSGRRSGRSA